MLDSRLDLLDLDSVRDFGDGADHPIDMLINNAGIGGQPRRLSPQGHESLVIGHPAEAGAVPVLHSNH